MDGMGDLGNLGGLGGMCGLGILRVMSDLLRSGWSGSSEWFG